MSGRAQPQPTKKTGVYTRDLINPRTGKSDTCYDITYKEKVDGRWKTRWVRAIGWKSEKFNPGKAEKERLRRITGIEEGRSSGAALKAQEDAAGTIGEYFNNTVMTFQTAENKAGSSQKCKARYEKHIAPVFGHLRFNQVTVGMINEWRDRLMAHGKTVKVAGRQQQGPLSQTTVGILLNILHQIFRIARTNGVIRNYPFNETVLKGRRRTIWQDLHPKAQEQQPRTRLNPRRSRHIAQSRS